MFSVTLIFRYVCHVNPNTPSLSYFKGLSPAPQHAKAVVYRQQWTTSPAYNTKPEVKDVTKEVEKYYIQKQQEKGYYPSEAHSKYVTSPEVCIRTYARS